MVRGLGRLGIHFGVNLNTSENYDGQGLSAWVGLDKEVNSELSIITEYDFTWNDLDTKLTRGCGYMNAGLRWTFGQQLFIELDFKDILKNRSPEYSGTQGFAREIKVMYIESL